MKTVAISGNLDDLRSDDIRFLEEASNLGDLQVLLWTDETVRKHTGKDPKFPQDERLYMMRSNRYVDQVTLATAEKDVLPSDIKADIWVVNEQGDTPQKQAFCDAQNITYRVLTENDTKGHPPVQMNALHETSKNKKVIVTGCYDWFHSGHIRFFEEVSELGDLYVVVGHDENVRFLKGEGHPMFNQDERRYVVQSIRFVIQALIASGNGWMDAAPEIDVLKPDIYAVNEDGDKPEKKAFCEEHGLEYVVLKRTPKEGLPRRESTALRGF
jgi:cytidyltransferase-like protein